jgi:hypothetical protein
MRGESLQKHRCTMFMEIRTGCLRSPDAWSDAQTIIYDNLYILIYRCTCVWAHMIAFPAAQSNLIFRRIETKIR